MAARNFVAVFVLLALDVAFRSDSGSTLGDGVNVPCNVCYNIVCPNCEPNGALSWRPSPPPVCVEKVSAAPKCTDIQVQCAKLRACKFNCNNIQKQFEVELATACVNDSQSLLSICKLPDDIPDTLEGGCYLSCGPPEKPGEEDSTLRPEEEECHEIERTFCRRPGRGHNCTGRCIQNAKNSCLRLIEDILRENFTRDDVAASAEALQFYPRFLSNSSIDLDEVIGSVDSFHRALKRQRQRALEYYNKTETIEQLVSVYDTLLEDDLLKVWNQQSQMSGLGPMLLQSLENAMELFAESAQMNLKALNITLGNIEMDIDCSNQELYQRTLSQSVSGEMVFTSFDLPLQRLWSTEGNGCVSASVTRHLADYVHFNSSEFNHLSPAPNTPLLSINAIGSGIPSGQKAHLYFSRSQMANSTVENITCVFWNFTKQDWTALPVEWNDTHFICSTNHLTSFAILVTITGAETVDASHALTIISYIGCGVSIICLFATILTLIILRKKINKGVLLYIHLNFAVALLASLIVFVAGIETANHIGWLCTLVAALLHYLFLCVFCWMLAEGIMLYLLVVRVFGTAAKKWYYLLILGWDKFCILIIMQSIFISLKKKNFCAVFPILIVAISAGVRHMDYGTINYCWLSTRNGVIWEFVAPILAIIMDSDQECCCSPSPAGADVGVWAAGSQQEHHRLCLALHHLQLPARSLRFYITCFKE